MPSARSRENGTYIVSSTFSGVRPYVISPIALLALSIAARVSRLMLADSIELICCSRVPICFTVCSIECSWFFLRLSAVNAAAKLLRLVFCSWNSVLFPSLRRGRDTYPLYSSSHASSR